MCEFAFADLILLAIIVRGGRKNFLEGGVRDVKWRSES